MPSLLETFVFVFEADTKSVKKGVDEGKRMSDELAKKFEGLDATANKVGTAFLELAKNAGKAAASLVALSTMKRIIADTTAHTFEVRQQAKALAISTEALSVWQNSVVTAGGTAEGATQSLAGLQQKLIELSRFPGGMTPDGFMLHRLGLSTADMHRGIADPMSAMEKLSSTFSGLTAVQQQFVGKRLGFDQGTIALLAEGRRAMDEHIARMKALGVVTQQQAEAAAAFRNQQKELGIELETGAREIVTAILPALTWMLKKVEQLVDFLRTHRGFTIAFFTGVGLVIADVVVPAFASAAAAVWAFLAPIVAGPLLIAAVVAALALLWDDAEHFLNGQNSLLGELAKKWPMFGQIVKTALTAITDGFKGVLIAGRDTIDYLVAFFQFLGDVITEGPTKAIENFGKKTHAIFADLKKYVGGVIDDGKALAKGFSDIWHGKNPFASADEHAAGAASKAQTATGKELAAKFEKLGWSPVQAAGIAGSLLQESSGNPNARNPVSGAQGLGQWLGSRKADFEKYAGHSLDTATMDEQIGFMNYELRYGKEQRAGRMLEQAQTPEEAARIHAQYYERPGAAEANIARREMLADAIAQGQQQVNEASTNPINAQNSNTIYNGTIRTSGAKTINVGPTTVHTQAMDSKALARDYSAHLSGQLKNAQDQDDDGIVA